MINQFNLRNPFSLQYTEYSLLTLYFKTRDIQNLFLSCITHTQTLNFTNEEEEDEQ